MLQVLVGAGGNNSYFFMVSGKEGASACQMISRNLTKLSVDSLYAWPYPKEPRGSLLSPALCSDCSKSFSVGISTFLIPGRLQIISFQLSVIPEYVFHYVWLYVIKSGVLFFL